MDTTFLLVTAGGVVGSAWLLRILLRSFVHSAFPGAVPGEENTILLASARPSSTEPAVAKDLENVTAYDYIIVGTGTAGCVLANRLTEDPSVSVLAIESGHSDLRQLFSRIPAAFAQLFKTAADHDITTTPQTNAGGRAMQWPRGRMLGGCSAINAMIYNKGAPDDYDEWEKLGNKGWSYKDVLPYMKKAECFKESSSHWLTREDLEQHGRSGPWQTGYSYCSKFARSFIDACVKQDIPEIADCNTRTGMNGTVQFQTFIDSKGQRSSAAVAYLDNEVCRRPNLKIAVGQTVTRVIFDESGPTPRAVGVEMSAGGATPIRYLAAAKKEVILSTGAIHTPHILKLSGIGPATELKALGIPLIKDLPAVGANLVDHIFASVCFKITKGYSLQYLADPIASLSSLVEWLRHGTGPMTCNVADAAAFLRTADRPDAPQSLRQNDLASGKNGSDLEILQAALVYRNHGAHKPIQKGDFASIGPVMLRPESRGTVKLSSTNPFEPPLVDANYYSTKHDIDLMLYGMKLSQKIAEATNVFQSWDWPQQVPTMTDEQMMEHIRNTSETLYHPMCTAKMGPDAKDSVVDAKLRVHGVQGLRVADASIFPTPLACHPCAPVIMVGEKAADLIKETW